MNCSCRSICILVQKLFHRIAQDSKYLKLQNLAYPYRFLYINIVFTVSGISNFSWSEKKFNVHQKHFARLLGRGGNTLVKKVQTPNNSPDFFPAKTLMRGNNNLNKSSHKIKYMVLLNHAIVLYKLKYVLFNNNFFENQEDINTKLLRIYV